MNAATRQRLELAQEDARRRQHATTEPEHLLAVSLAFDAVAVAVHARGLDPSELRDCLEAALAEKPTVGGYRDAGGAPLSPALERALKRTRRWFRGVTLLETLFQEPSIASVVWLLRRGADQRYVVERSLALAIVRHHAIVGVEHALRALVDLRSFVATLERAGGNAKALATALETRLTPDPGELKALPKLDVTLTRVLAGAKFPETSDDPATIRQVCMALAREDACAPFWSDAGITRSAFLEAVLVPK